MTFPPSPWVEMNGGNPGHTGRSKRLCTGLGNASEPRSTVQTQWAHSQTLPEQSPSNVARYESNIFDVQACSASPVHFNNVPRQQVGSAQPQTLIQDHQHSPWPSSNHKPRPSWLEVVNSTPSAYHQVPDVQAGAHPASNEYDSWNPPSSVISFQPTPTSNTPHEGYPDDQYHQWDVGTIPQHGCHDSVSDGTSEPKKSVDTGLEDTSYELCLGLVSQACLWHKVLRPGILAAVPKIRTQGVFEARRGSKDWLQAPKLQPFHVL